MDRGEFLRFLGLWLLILEISSGFDKIEYWSSVILCAENSTPFQFNEWISKSYFKNIQNTLFYNDEDPVVYEDKFYSARKIIRL